MLSLVSTQVDIMSPTIELVNLCIGEENIFREKSVCRYDLAEKFLLILIEPCHCENIENTYLVFLVTSCLHTIFFMFIIVKCVKNC